jgi:hypothetical protein
VIFNERALDVAGGLTQFWPFSVLIVEPIPTKVIAKKFITPPFYYFTTTPAKAIL